MTASTDNRPSMPGKPWLSALVIARNERRVRQGLQPLEVEAEVTRTLEEFGR